MSSKTVMETPVTTSGCSDDEVLTLTDLPVELCLLVLEYLSPVDLGQLAQVCSSTRALIASDEVWGDRYRSNWKYKMPKEEKAPMRSMYISRFVIEKTWNKVPRPYILAGHKEWVTSIGYDYDGSIITISDDGISKRWDPRSNLCTGTTDTLNLGAIPQCTKKSRCLDFDDSFIIGGKERSILVWDGQQRFLHNLTGHTHTIDALEMQGDIAVSGSKDRTVRVWNLREGYCEKVLRGHEMGVIALQFDTEFNTIVTCSWDKTVIVWRMDAPEDDSLVARLHGHTEAVTCIAACFRNGFVASGSKDATVRLWSLETMSCVHVLKAHQKPVLCVAIDDFRIVSGGKDRVAVVWEVVPAHFGLGMEYDKNLDEKKGNVRLATVVARDDSGDECTPKALERLPSSVSTQSSVSLPSDTDNTNFVSVTQESIDDAKSYHKQNNHRAWAAAAAMATALSPKKGRADGGDVMSECIEGLKLEDACETEDVVSAR